MRRVTHIFGTTLIASIAIANIAAAEVLPTFDLAGDFNTVSNPNNKYWDLGSSPSPTEIVFTRFLRPGSNLEGNSFIKTWTNATGALVGKNIGPDPEQVFFLRIFARSFFVTPGGTEFPVVAWECPATGRYVVDIEFSGANNVQGSDGEGFVFHNDLELFRGRVTGFTHSPGDATTARYNAALELNAGDKLYLSVGDGGPVDQDWTGISARIVRSDRVSRAALRCLETIGKVTDNYARKSAKAIRKCRRLAMKGQKLFFDESGTEPLSKPEQCRQEYRTTQRLLRLVGRAEEVVQRRCSDELLETVASCAKSVTGLITKTPQPNGCILSIVDPEVDARIAKTWGQ